MPHSGATWTSRQGHVDEGSTYAVSHYAGRIHHGRYRHLAGKMSQLRSGPLYRASKPVRDPAYLRFIRALPCVACLRTWSVEAAHTGAHGIGQKSCDLKTIPLCRRCHPAFDAEPREFAETWKLDIPALIARFNEFYRTKLKGRAA